MAAVTFAGGGGFPVWLTEKLKSVSSDIDTDVFVSYIIGILDTDSSDDENEESITELLSGVIDPDAAQNICRSIIAQWSSEKESRNLPKVQEDVGEKLSKMFEKQTLATVKEKKISKEEAERKAAILAQYGQVSDGEESDHGEICDDESSIVPTGAAASAGGGGKSRGDSRDFIDPLLVRNVNKEEVQRIEREKREKAKEEQEKKKGER